MVRDTWYDRENIEQAIIELTELEQAENISVTFNAYSKLELTVEKSDNCGHFRLTINVQEPYDPGFNFNFEIDNAMLAQLIGFLKVVLKGF